LSLAELFAELRALGVELRVEGERVRCLAAPGVLTRELADAIREHKEAILAVLGEAAAAPAPAGTTGIPRAEQRHRYELAISQQRVVVSARESAVLPTAFRLRGELDAAALAATLSRIVARHAPLRTRFELAHEPPRQEVLPEVPVELGRADVSGLPAEARPARLREILAEQRAIPFDPATGPLFRFHLTRISEREHVLFAAFSALVFDGWSFDVLWNELRLGYAALVRQEPWPFPDLAIEYADYVAWQRARLAEREAALGAFWRERLGAELPPLPLPVERPRPRLPSTRGGSIPFELPAALAVRLRTLARAEAVTPQMTMLAGLYAFLHQAGGRERIIVGTPVEARAEPALEGMIGPCVNMLLLPARLDGQESFGAFVRRLRDECLTAYEHQEYPIERLQVRSPRSPDGVVTPAFQVELSYQQVSQRGAHMGALSLSQIELESGAATNDLTFWVKDWGERIAGAVEYKADLYDRETIEHWAACYLHLLEAATLAPATPVGELPLLGPERAAVEAAGRRVAEDPPAWLRARLDPGAAVQAVRVVDAARGLRPFSLVGEVVVETASGLVATGARGVLTHDGRLRESAEAAAAAAPRRSPAVAPVGDLETQLVGLFAELLGTAEVGAEDNYFDLGGNSLVAVRLLAEVQRRFGMRLPLATLLTDGTPRALARAIQQQVPSDECLVPLKPSSSGRYVFLIHDADGETLLYRNLALRIPDPFGVYAVQPRRVGRVPMAHATIAAAACHYVAEVLRVQPRGPYHLGGLCAGGVLAFEMARHLVAAGHEVASLFFIDAAPPTARKRTSLGTERAERFGAALHPKGGGGPLSILRVAAGKVRRAASWEWRSRRERLDEVARRQLLLHVFPEGRDWPAWLEPPTPRAVLALAEREMATTPLREVRPVLFRATAGTGTDQPFTEILSDPGFDWQPWCAEPLTIVDVAGGHSSLLQEPHVADLAAHVSKLVTSEPAQSEPASRPAGARPDGVVVDVITVSYRTAGLVVQSLAALAAEREHAAARGIVVNATIVDNCREDAPAIRAAMEREGWGAWVTLIEAPRNGGFAYGNNLGFRHGWQRERVPDYFFLLNPDAMVRPGAVVALVDFLEQRTDAASAASRLEDGSGNVWPYAFRFPSLVGETVSSLGIGPLYRLFSDHAMLRPMGACPQPVDWFPGAAMMVRSEVIRQLGGMDESYFLYFEETDFCLKLTRAGWTNWYVPASHVVHESGQSTGVTGKSGVGKRLPPYWFESRRRYFAKNHGVAYTALLDSAVVAANALQAVYRGALGKPSDRPPKLVPDLLRSSVLVPGNRVLPPAAEFHPDHG